MADDPHHGGSPKSDPVDNNKEDADTAAARKELKQTAISGEQKAEADAADTGDEASGRKTPDEASKDDDLIEQVSSPKKKRARDATDEGDEGEQGDAHSVASSDSAKDRTSRLGPEKKRHRDDGTAEKTDQDEAAISADKDSSNSKPAPTSTDDKSSTKPSTETKDVKEGDEKDNKSSASSGSAFASSGFAKLATTGSAFGSMGNTKSVFGGSASTSTASPFASASSPQKSASPAPMPTLQFGNKTEASPFASAAGSKPGANGSGSVFGGGSGKSVFGGAGTGGSVFGSGLSTKPLSSFGKPGESLASGKPAKPFGAPDSDAEDDKESDDDGSGADDENADNKDESDNDDSKSTADDKKKGKLQKVTLDDGETGETTVLAVRAKLYFLEKEHGWRERGSGMLKINVPHSAVSFEDGVPVPGSFDASAMEDDEADDEAAHESRPKVVRLLMRQDSTHRMLLNTAILPALDFQQKTTLKSVGILFTAFEGDGQPVSVQAKMSAQSAKSFMNEIGLIQRELSGN